MKQVMSISVADCIDLVICWGDVGFGWSSTILDSSGKRQTSKAFLKEIFGFKDVYHDFIPEWKRSCVWIDLVGQPLASWAPKVYKKLGGRWGSSVFTDMVSDGPMSHGKFGRKFGKMRSIWMSIVVISDSPKNVNNDAGCRPLVGFCDRGEVFSGVGKSEDDAGEILEFISQGDCGNATTGDNEDVTPVIAPFEKDSIIAPPLHPGYVPWISFFYLAIFRVGVIMATFKEAILLLMLIEYKTKDAG
ncbi:hypothetical protein Tco_0697208 [Tanacetum coccineum]